MKLRYIDLLKCVPCMKIICEKDNIPFSSALLISKNAACIDKEIEIYFQKKGELDEKYLTHNTEEKLIIKDGLEKDYLKLLTELNEKEVEVNIQKISVDSLSNIFIAPKHIESITFMLD